MGKIYIGDTLISITPGSTEAEAAYTKSQSDQKITDLIDGAPGTLDTLNEIAEGIGNLKLDSLADVEIKDGKVGTVDTISGGAEVVDGTYTGVTVASSGSGTGASFDVVVASGSVGSITVNTAGSGYVVDETLSMTEESLGYDGSAGPGSDPLTFDVATLADAGIMIYDATAAGTKADPHFINKTLSEIGIVTSTSPVITGDFTVDTDTLKVDSTNNYVGINQAIPAEALDVSGNVKVNGDLTVDTDTLKVDSTNNRVGIGTAVPSADHNLTVTGSSLFNHNILLPGVSKAFTKQNCYFKNGGIRLQKAAADTHEVTLRYDNATSDNFCIEQSHNSAAAGHIKFLGDTPTGSNSIRLSANQIDLGFDNGLADGSETVLINIASDTNIVADKKLVFKDSSDKTHGLHFEHSAAAAGAVQLGMYGSNGDADFGQFKITHTDTSAVNTVVLSVSNDGASVTIDKPTTFTGAITGTLGTASQPNITSVGNLTSLVVSDINTAAGNNLTIGATAGSGVGGSVLIASQNISIDSDTLLLNGEKLNIGSGDAAAIKIDSTATGNDNIFLVNAITERVGINKAIPAEALDVVGNIKASGNVTATNVTASGTVDLSSFTAAARSTDLAALTPDVTNRPTVDDTDTLSALCVDSAGNVVKGSQEATWTFTRAQLNTLTQTPGITLLSAPGAGKCIILEDSHWLLTSDASESGTYTADMLCEIAGQTDYSIGTALSRAKMIIMSESKYGGLAMYNRDVPGGTTMNDRISQFNQPMNLRMRDGSTTAFPAKCISIQLKIKYRVYDSSTF